MLKTRIITALLLLGGLLAAVFLLPALGWLLFCAVLGALAAWEWGGLSRFATPLRAVYALAIAATCLLLGGMAGLGGNTGMPAVLWLPYALAALFWLFCVPFWLRAKWQLGRGAAAVVVGIVVLVPPALALAHLRELGPWLLLAALAVCWVADIAAYFAGRRFGRRKLAPAISPGKTWEGAWGAVAGVLVYGLSALWLLFAPAASGLLAVVPALLLLTALSIIGDLFESLLKRQAGIKDSGSLLPGHGGILDRIDSLTSTLPLLGLAALWFAR